MKATIEYDVSQFPPRQSILDILIFHELKAALSRADVVKVYRGRKLIARIGKTGMKAWQMGREGYTADARTYWLRSKWKEYKRLDAVARCIAEWR